MQESEIIAAVKQWLETFVIGLNLCPFASRELLNNRIRFKLSTAGTEQELLIDLASEFKLLDEDQSVETTLLIHPQVLQDFDDYNRFLTLTELLIEQLDLEGIYQLASFHPRYRFAGTEPEDLENFTNRSPYPMLHVIREQSLQQAIADYPDVTEIPARNIALMRQLGSAKLMAMKNRDRGD